MGWSERKQAATSSHSQLYCFTLQPMLSMDCRCAGEWTDAVTDRPVLVSTSVLMDENALDLAPFVDLVEAPEGDALSSGFDLRGGGVQLLRVLTPQVLWEGSEEQCDTWQCNIIVCVCTHTHICIIILCSVNIHIHKHFTCCHSLNSSIFHVVMTWFEKCATLWYNIIWIVHRALRSEQMTGQQQHRLTTFVSCAYTVHNTTQLKQCCQRLLCIALIFIKTFSFIRSALLSLQ